LQKWLANAVESRAFLAARKTPRPCVIIISRPAQKSSQGSSALLYRADTASSKSGLFEYHAREARSTSEAQSRIHNGKRSKTWFRFCALRTHKESFGRPKQPSMTPTSLSQATEHVQRWDDVVVSEISKLESYLVTKSHQVTEWKQKFEACQQTLDKTKIELQRKVANEVALKDKVAELEAELERTIQQKNAELGRLPTNATDEKQGNVGDGDAMMPTRHTIRDEYLRLIDAAQEQHDALAQSLRESQARVQDLESRLDEKNCELDECRQAVEIAKQESAPFKAKIAELEKTTNDRRQIHGEDSSRLLHLRSKTEQDEAKFRRLMAEVTEEKSRMEAEIQKLRRMVENQNENRPRHDNPKIVTNTMQQERQPFGSRDAE
jgi:chromosome segregation ATPase